MTSEAVFAAGAGVIGDYSRCSWYTEGTGTFLGGEGTTPNVGKAGRRSASPSCASRRSFPAGLADAVVAALRAAHPVRGSRVRRVSACVKARLFTDGGARGNPGPAAFGYVLEAEDGTVLAAHGEAIGVATNNVAEYRGLIAGLERAVELQVGEVEVVSDSELLVKQMRGEYRVKNEALQAAVARGGTARPASREGELHRRPARAQRARRPARERSSRRGRQLKGGAILAAHADVAQLARASACHAEGRGFESHHPLSKALETRLFCRQLSPQRGA